jgi:hypothetical protein|tara:strand:+ start:342 stop:581 length:240 start_codon:yes stop_codon:yes gene_type:complete
MGYGKKRMGDGTKTNGSTNSDIQSKVNAAYKRRRKVKTSSYGHGGYVSDAMKDRAQGFGIQNPSSSPFTCGSKKKKRKK